MRAPEKHEQERDPTTAVLPEEMLALGDDAVPTLLRVVAQRALAHDRTFEEEARTLPREWRNVVLAAGAVQGIEESGSFAGAFRHVRQAIDMRELRSFFAVLEVEPLAEAFDEAQLYATEIEEGAEASTIEELDALLHVDAIDFGDVWRALTQAAAMIGEEFPASFE